MNIRRKLYLPSPEEQEAERKSMFQGMLWSFFKPIIIGWGGFALLVWLVKSLRG